VFDFDIMALAKPEAVIADGTVFGIEILNANQQLKAGDEGNLAVVNEALAQHQDIPLGEKAGDGK
jgi:hypothetical protein